MFFAPVNKGLTFTKTHSGKNSDYRMCLIWLLLKMAKKGLNLLKAKHMPLWYSGRYVIDILKIVQFVKNFQKFAHMFNLGGLDIHQNHRQQYIGPTEVLFTGH